VSYFTPAALIKLVGAISRSSALAVVVDDKVELGRLLDQQIRKRNGSDQARKNN